MNIKRILLLTLFLFSFCLLTPQTSKAVDLKQVLTSENSIITKIQEGVEYFLAFKTENKVQVLEKQAERRLTMAKGYADQGNEERVQSVMQSYLQIKERENQLLGKPDMKEVLGDVEKRTIEQQKTMEEIKTKIDDKGKQGVIQIQEKVVNQVGQKVVEVNGTKGQAEFFNKVEHVWAPGTGPGGEAGVVIKGGAMEFAPGTSAGGAAGSDIKTVEVKTGGGDGGGTNVVEGGNQGTAPGTTSGGSGGTTTTTNTIDPGSGLAPGTTLEGKNELAP
jgi:hypothetical protein